MFEKFGGSVTNSRGRNLEGGKKARVETILKQFETILFPHDMIQDMIQDKLHWNMIHKGSVDYKLAVFGNFNSY